MVSTHLHRLAWFVVFHVCFILCSFCTNYMFFIIYTQTPSTVLRLAFSCLVKNDDDGDDTSDNEEVTNEGLS